MGEQSDGFVGAVGSLWNSVMSIECGNECLRVEHNLFCTNCLGLGVLSGLRQFADMYECMNVLLCIRCVFLLDRV